MGTIAEKLTYLNGTKSAIKDAIEDKGVTVPAGATFRDFADLIGDIGGGGAQVAVGTFNTSTSGTTKVTLGFKPKYLALTMSPTSFDTTPTLLTIYNEDFDANACMVSVSTGLTRLALPSTQTNRLKSIDNDGFTYNQMSASGGTYGRYFAIEDATPSSAPLMMAPPTEE